MKYLFLLCAMLVSATTLANPPGQRRESTTKRFVMVTLEQGASSEELAAAARSVGKLLGRDRGETRYRIQLKPGVTLANAMTTLQASKHVAAVQIAVPPHSFAKDMNSVQGLERRLATLRAERKAAESGPTPEGADEGEGLNRWEARKFYIQQRAYPNDTIDTTAYYRATKQRDAMTPTKFGGTGAIQSMATESRWESIGPKNLGVPNIFTGPAPLSGRVNTIGYHPTTPTTFYVGTSSGGVWKTTDNGATFNPAGDFWQFINVSSMAVAPNNGNVVYVGTGDFNAWAGFSMGIMKTTDGGNTWTQLGIAQGFANFAVSDILIDPGNANNITVTLGRGNLQNGTIYRSMDGGATWTQVLAVAAEWSDLAISAAVGSTRYYYATSNEGLIYRSSNRGATWAPIGNPLVAGGFAHNRIACPPSDGNVAYLLDGNAEQVFKTGTAGTSWINVTGAFPWDIGFGPSFTNWAQSWYDGYIAVGRQGANDIVWVGLIDLNRSSNSGGTWTRAGMVYNTSAKVHPDQQCMVFHPTNALEGLLGNDGGLYRFTYDAVANTFTTTPLNLQLATTEFYKFDIHPSNADIVIGGTQDNSTPYSKNGDLNNWINVVGGDGGFAAINPADSLNQYGSSQFLNIDRTDNDWLSSSDITPSMPGENPAFIAPLVLDVNDSDLLYAGSNFLHRYDRSAGIWDLRLGAKNFNSSILAIAVAPGNSTRVYVGTTNSELWVTQNSGLTWTQIDTGSTSIPNRSITSLSVSASNISDIVVGLSGTGGGHLYRCTNVLASVATLAWTNVSGVGATGLPDTPLNAVVRDVDSPDSSWHVATDVGVFTTFNGGATWSNSTAPLGLPNVHCNDLRMRNSDRTLYVATYGRGIWRMAMPVRNAVTGLSATPTTLSGGSNSTGTVTIASAAGLGGTLVTLASTDPKTCVVPASVTVPQGLTTVNFTIQCVNNTNGTRLVTVTAARPGSGQGVSMTVKPSNYAQYISQSVPATMVAGQTYAVNVVYKNVGGTTWSLPLGYKVQSKNPTNNLNWGYNRIPVSGTVAPNANGLFQITAIAPTVGGTYNYQWQPIHEGVANFGPLSPNVAVVVTVAADAARYISKAGVPTTINAGNDFSATLTMRNVGTNSWPVGTTYQLRTRNPIDNVNWGLNRINVAEATAQGVNAAFTSTFTAPITAGTYNFQWSMTKGATTFGDLTSNSAIVVVIGANNAEFLSQVGVPTTIPRNTTFSATVSMTNRGTATWTSASGHTLQSANATTWNVASILPTGSVTTGNSNAFTATFTSPAAPGTYTFQWRMKSGTTGFGQMSTPVTITVT